MTAVSHNEDLFERLVFARVGWCDLYNETEGDEPQRGGKWNVDEIGSEFANFSVINGRVYGYAKAGTERGLNGKRVTGAPHGPLNDISIVLFASPPGGKGQFVVGWYRHATAFRAYRDRPGGAYGVYLWHCKKNDAVLLPWEAREFDIPKRKGATGRANVTYTRDADGRLTRKHWAEGVRDFIMNYRGSSLVGFGARASRDQVVANDALLMLRGQAMVMNARLRRAIELHAVDRVREQLTKEFDEVREVPSPPASFDFHCRNGQTWRKIEVKGTRTLGESLLFSDAEVELAKSEPVDLYIVSEIVVSSDGHRISTSGGRVQRPIRDWGRKSLKRKARGWQVFVAP